MTTKHDPPMAGHYWLSDVGQHNATACRPHAPPIDTNQCKTKDFQSQSRAKGVVGAGVRSS